MNSTELRAKIEELAVALAALEIELAQAEEDEAEASAPKEFNMWTQWEADRKNDIVPFAPVLSIPEGAEQYGDWYWDDELGFIYKPLLDLRDEWAASDDRTKRYCANTYEFFARTYITAPEDWEPTQEYGQWLALNYDAGQRTNLFMGGYWSAGYANKPVYEEFTFDEEEYNPARQYMEVKSTLIPGYKLLHHSKRRHENLLDVLERARTGFEKHWERRGPSAMVRNTANKLKKMDRWYSGFDDEGKAAFLLRNPTYEPHTGS